MKRFACLMLMLMLLFSAALATEPDEQDIALSDDEGEEQSIQTAPDAVFAHSDAAQDGWERVIEFPDTPEFVELLLDVARGELGYTEGPDNQTKYGKWSGDEYAAWCAEFICWCVNEVDERHGTSLLKNVYPQWSGQNTGRNWFIKRGRFVYRKGSVPEWGYQWRKGDDHYLQKEEYIPRPGDLVFFAYNEAGDTEHVALVEYASYDSEGYVIINVIEGNNPSAVQRNKYRLSNSQVLGFGLCQDLVDTVMRSGNQGDKVLELQQNLHRLGLLDERHLTGGFGGNTKKAVMQFQQTYLRDHSASGIADRVTQQAIEALLTKREFEDPETWLVTD